MIDRERIAMRLDLVAAKAKILAQDIRTGITYPGEVSRSLAELESEVRKASEDAREDR